jgi:hypothetical protein
MNVDEIVWKNMILGLGDDISMLCSMCVTHEVKYDDLYNKLL